MDQNIINDANDEWCGCLRACVQAKGGHFDFEQLLWQYSATWRDVSAFVKCDTIFRLFFWKLPQIRTSKFRKVLRQHTEGVVGSVVWVLLKIYFSFQFPPVKQFWKSIKNWQKLLPWVWCTTFWDTVYIVIQTAKLKIYSQYRQSFYRPIQLYFYLAVNLLDKF